MNNSPGLWTDEITMKEVSASKKALKGLLKNSHFGKFIEQRIKPNCRKIFKKGLSLNEINKVKSDLFEARFLYEIVASSKCSEIEYEFEAGPGESSIDFKFIANGKTWLLELTSLRDSKNIKDKTWEKELDGGISSFGFCSLTTGKENNIANLEIIKAQNALINKTINEDGGAIKFPEVIKNQYHIIAIDMRGFLCGRADDEDFYVICYGDEGTNLSSSDTPEIVYLNTFNGKPIVGIFDDNHPHKERASFLKERIHAIFFVNEIKNITSLYFNPKFFSLEEAKKIYNLFPLKDAFK